MPLARHCSRSPAMAEAVIAMTGFRRSPPGSVPSCSRRRSSRVERELAEPGRRQRQQEHALDAPGRIEDRSGDLEQGVTVRPGADEVAHREPTERDRALKGSMTGDARG